MSSLMDRVRPNTLVDEPRLSQIASFLSKTKYLAGDVAEVGLYKGGSALWIISQTDKPVHLFDTFCGLPAPTPEDNHHKLGDFNDTSVAHVAQLLASSGKSNYRIHQGLFPVETGHVIADRKFSFVHLDCDMHDSVKNCLLFFYKRMVSGGIIALDDYNEVCCLGAKKATDDFCAEYGIKVIPTVQSQAIIEVR